MQQAFAQVLAANGLHVDVHVGIALREFLDRARQHAQAQRRRAGQPQHAAAAAAHGCHAVLDALQAHEVPLDGVEQVLGLACRTQAATLHVEQLQAAGLLRLRQQAADRRLGGAQHLRGTRGGAGQHYRVEGFDLTEIQRSAHGVTGYCKPA